MHATLEKAWGYQGSTTSLPVADLTAALPFYERVLGFTIVSKSNVPYPSALLARDQVQIGLGESGGDPTQDGCAFQVRHLESLLAEFNARGLTKDGSAISVEEQDGVPWRVFYVVAPDGLCYWFGEKQGGEVGQR